MKMMFTLMMLLASAPLLAQNPVRCVEATGAVQHMETGKVHVKDEAGNSVMIDVLIADDNQERAAGFQHICADTITDTAILFRFPREMYTAFHMRNVHAPLDIAFMNSNGVVVDVLRMETYVNSPVFTRQPTYQPHAPFRYALETAAGRMETLGIVPGTRMLLD